MDEDEKVLKRMTITMLISLLERKIFCLRLEVDESIVINIEKTFNELKELIYEQMGTE